MKTTRLLRSLSPQRRSRWRQTSGELPELLNSGESSYVAAFGHWRLNASVTKRKLLLALFHARFGNGFAFAVGTAFGAVADGAIFFAARIAIDQVLSDRASQRNVANAVVAIRR